MSDQTNHALHRIQAWLDGEISGDEAREIESHCKSCESCGKLWREQLEIREVLGADPAADPMAPMWPAVEKSLRGRGVPGFGFSFAFGTTAAAVAGLALGVFIGSVSTTNGEGDIWSEIGSTMTAESGMASDVYLDSTEEERDDDQ
jgi:anti-sigma factor RsiW